MYKNIVLVLWMQCHGIDMTLYAPKIEIECITTIHLFVWTVVTNPMQHFQSLPPP